MSVKHPLNPQDVVLSNSWGVSRGRLLRSNSRASQWTGYTLELLHLPTGLRVLGQVPSGVYTRPEIVAHRQALYERLVEVLAGKVAAYGSACFRVTYGLFVP